MPTLLQYTLCSIDELLLVLALTIDSFTISLLYGSQRIHIPVISNLIINVTATAVLMSSILFGTLLRSFVPEAITRYLSFLILCGIGGCKCIESLQNQKLREGDQNHDQILSAKEAFAISCSLSMDGVSIGIGAALVSVHSATIAILSFVVGILAVWIGGCSGRILAKKIKFDCSLIGGIMIILFAFTRI